MKTRLLHIILTLIFLAFGMEMKAQAEAAQQPADSAFASLLTCSPGQEAYEVYGHTAVRVHLGEDDWVFNYGVFSFHERFFLWRWLLGNTDYSVEPLRYTMFQDFYTSQGRTITEQRLNLQPTELQRLCATLFTDAHEARFNNWTYRYNFFYDNCTTRVLDAIETALGDSAHIEWPAAKEQTLREMLHQFATPTSPWLSEGQDLLIGTEVDEPATMRQQLFSPIWASYYASQATIVHADGSRTPLVSGSAATLPDTDVSNPLELPFCIVGLLLLAGAFFRRFRGGLWQMHVAVHTLQGLVGTLIAMLFFFSSHPAVDSNWLLALFNPLWLIAAWYVWRYRNDDTERWGSVIYIGWITVVAILCLIGHVKGQIYPFSATLLGYYLILFCINDSHVQKK